MPKEFYMILPYYTVWYGLGRIVMGYGHSLMLNNFCFHVYAQKSLFIGEIGNGFFLQHPPL